jgi:hypothetical protein
MARKADATWYRMMGTSTKLIIRVDLLIAGTITVAMLAAHPRSAGWIPPGFLTAVAIYLQASYFLGGIRAAPSGVTVGKLAGRRIHVPWPDVERFALVPVRGRATTYYIGVVRKDAKPVLTAACCYEEALRRKRRAEIKAHAAQVIDALEADRLRQPGQSASQTADSAE